MNCGFSRPLCATLLATAAIGTLGGCASTPHSHGLAAAASRPSESASSTAAAAPLADRTLHVNYLGGHVSGDVGRIPVAVGTVVDIVISSDVAEEAHLHGYNKAGEIPAGGTVTLRFTADVAGVFALELHRSDQELARLQISR